MSTKARGATKAPTKPAGKKAAPKKTPVPKASKPKAKAAAKPKTCKTKRGATVEAMDNYGISRLCEAIIDRKSLTDIAAEAGASLTRLLVWIDADPVRSARVREARTATAKLWDEKAESRIDLAKDEFELKKAKELAHHYRWRAAKIASKEYGDKVSVDANVDVRNISDEDLNARLAAKLGAVAALGAATAIGAAGGSGASEESSED